MASKNNKPKFLVGLGASAGGLDALEQFLDHAPTDSGAAFIVVMHLSRDFKSMLDELLARHTKMKVAQAVDGAELHADTVYVIQPKTFLEVGAKKLNVEVRPDVDPEGVATAVDVMFRSIAKNWGQRGAAIVLSGSGSDGARGVRAVRDAGGFTCAQSPETAKFDPMPIAAIATESVNAVEPPDHLGRTVIDGLLMPMIFPQSPAGTDHENVMAKIVDAVIGSSSIKAKEYKHSTFERRVSRRMMALRINDIANYANKVAEDPIEARNLSQELLIGVTDFFRDAEPFRVITNQIVPQIIKEADEENRSIRIWIAGCATGEEVYSLAILFREALRDLPFELDVQIFGTDVSKKHLAEATRGIYSRDRVASIPQSLLERYFEQNDETGDWTVIKRLRKMVVFAPHDLLSDPPFTKLDLVCCRNVLIYFSIEAQQRILGGFAFGLRQGGFLFLGSSETVGAQRDVFEFIDPRNRIFRRTQSTGQVQSLKKARELFPVLSSATRSTRKTTRVRNVELQPAYTALLEKFAPPSLLISEERELLHSFGDASIYLRPPTGAANLDVSELIDPALKMPLIAAIERSIKEDSPLTFSKITLEETPEKGAMVDLTIQPLSGEENNAPRYFLAIIDASKYAESDGEEAVPAIDADKLMAGRNTDLEVELTRTREALQSTIEENETANEELQASNEELMSANEELQSTNEELSSVNEELYSVNAEYHRQNDDLSRLTNDFDLLLNATQIGVLFLDDSGIITRFTGLAKKIFNFEENDIGRPVANFTSPFPDFDPATVLDEAPNYGSVIEQEAIGRDGKPWLIRIVSDDANFGVVLAFIDIDELRGAEAELRKTHGMLQGIRTATNSYFMECDPEFKTVYSQVGYDDFIGEPDMQLPFTMTYGNVHKDDLAALQQYMSEGMRGEFGEFIYRMFSVPMGEYRYIRVSAQKLENGNWQVVSNDVDEIYCAEVDLREQRAILQATLSSGRTYKAFVDQNNMYGFTNEAYCSLLGTTPEEIVGRSLVEMLPPQLYEQARENIKAALAGEYREGIIEAVIDGEHILLSVRYCPVEEGESIIGFVFDGINISEIAKYAEKFSTNDRMITAATRLSAQPFMVVGQSDGRIYFANDIAQEMLGLSNGEFAEDKFNISRLTPECGEDRWQEFLTETAVQGDLMLNDMVVFDRARNSKMVDVYLESNPVDEDLSIVTVRVIENVIKQKVMGDLRERSRRLASSNRDLEQFTTAVAHDLRAPLRHITSFSDMLGVNTEKLSPEEVKGHANIIATSARNLSNMVGGLLDYARIGLRETQMVECELGEVFEAVERNLSEDLATSNAKLSVSGAGQMLGNHDLLVSLFQNLVSNSIKYGKAGIDPEIQAEIEENDGRIIISIADNGIGIDADFADKIFELFRRLHSDEEYKGLGIGLTTCRKIAEIHKAEIVLDTDYTDGSKFVFHQLSARDD